MTTTTPIQLNTDYPNIPFAEYRAWPEISQSNIKQGIKSMRHMKQSVDGKGKSTSATDIGSAVHYGFLEPDKLADRVVVFTGKVKRGKAWDEFEAQNRGKLILGASQKAKLDGMLASLRSNTRSLELITQQGKTEVSRVMSICGVPVKARADKILADTCVDLKTTAAGLDERTFTNLAIKLGYHIQGAIYCKMWGCSKFVMPVVSSVDPYEVIVFDLDSELLAYGWRETKAYVSHWKLCCEKQEWPGRSDDEVVTIGLPAWLKSEAGYEPITKGGKPIF